MTIKSTIRRLPIIGRLSYWIRPAAAAPQRGFDVCKDIASLIEPKVIFDVGANIGQSAEQYLTAFPDARIYCFEPSAESAGEIRRRLGDRVTVSQIGLSREAGAAALSHDTGFSAGFKMSASGAESIRLDTLDSFCHEHGIERINFLKIDTEGHDLEVLKGAGRMLDGKIDVVQVEAGINPENDLHVPFGMLQSHLEAIGYRLFAIYEQCEEWPTSQPHLRRTNPIFISKKLQVARQP